MVAPAPGLTLDDKTEVNQLLVRSGASIEDINVVRKHLSAVKGGGLLAAANGARLCTLLISDVIGDDLSTIGSGPTVPDPSTYQDALDVLSAHGLLQQVPGRALARLHSGARGFVPETLKTGAAQAAGNWPLIVANLAQALAAISEHARVLGLSIEMRDEPMRGDTHVAARSFAAWVHRSLQSKVAGAPALVLIAGGETTLQVHGSGRGGRNQEFALIVANELQGLPAVTVLAAGTDGTDGPTDVAGAFADGSTLERAGTRGLDFRKVLATNDSYTLFDALGDHFRSGPTGTNVMDVCVAIVG
jgi:hydroxypyruvate reductase